MLFNFPTTDFLLSSEGEKKKKDPSVTFELATLLLPLVPHVELSLG